jgi:chromosome segregation ATPase
MEKSIFNKKRWIKSHLDVILTKKKEGLTYQAIIQYLIDHEKMPFDLSESLLSRYLKDFCDIEPSVSKRNEKLEKKNLRQIDRIAEQNNEIQNLKRRLERIQEQNITLDARNYALSERNRVMENKFLDGEARLKDLRRYNGYNNVHWKVADLEQKNDDLYQTILYLERRCEVIAEPLERTIEELERARIERDDARDQCHRMAKSIQTMKVDFQAKLDSAIQDKIAYEKQIDDLMNQKDMLEANIKRLQSDLDVLNGELQLIQEKLHSEQNKANEVPIQIGFLENENVRLKQLVERLKNKINALDKKQPNEQFDRNQDKLVSGVIGFIIGVILVLAIFMMFK